MCIRAGARFSGLTVLFLLAAAGMRARGQGDGTGLSNRGGESESEQELNPFTSKPNFEVHEITTSFTPSFPDHRPNLRGLLLHEALLTKDFQGDQQFFKEDGGLEAQPTASGPSTYLETGDSATHVVPHEDAPAFSDIATTAMTTVSPTLPGKLVSMPQKRPSKGRERTAEKLEVTSQALTTPVLPATTRPNIRQQTSLASTKAHLSERKAASKDNASSSATAFTKKEPLRPAGKSLEGNHTDVDEETMTSTIHTTTIISTMRAEGQCSMNFTDAEGDIEMPPRADDSSTVDCTYLVTVYLGYGVEIQVLNVTLMEGEEVVLEDLGGLEPSILANESVLTRGLVVRSSSNQISIRFSSEKRHTASSLLLRYRAFVLSCAYPQTPANGEVSVSSLHAGGEAYFFCLTGYQLQGPSSLTCRNATMPYWSGKEPKCLAACGGMVKNATLGRIVSPGFPGNYSNNLTCHWVLEAPEGHRLHVHFEKVALAEDDDRLLIKNGNNIDSPPIYDSYEVEYLPNEGVVSTGRHLFVEFTTDETGTCTGAAIRYEAFAEGTCYKPFVKYGNFSSSDLSYGVGTVVEFSCEPGYTLEQGSVTIECVDPDNPQWNETEPACRAVCSGEITDSAGVVLSPNWPEAYDKGQDCIWGIHVEEDKRIMLDIQVLHLGKNDILTFYDGDDLTANILGQYSGTLPKFKLYTSMADVTIQFQSDPATNIYGYNNGFVVHFFEVARNDTCSELPEIPNGWKSTSHPDLIHGTVVTYQCYPGYQVVGSEILMCQWDLTWSGDVPSCEKVMTCQDPGLVEHGRRVLTGSRFTVGSSVQYVCNKGYSLSGPGVLTCYSRDTADPKWSERLPKCVPERYEPCSNPGAPSTAIQSSEKAFFQAGDTLTFTCRPGYQLQGETTIRCIPGHPSQWSGMPPACRATGGDANEHRLDVVSSDLGAEGTKTAIAVMVPVAAVLLVILGIYLYFSKVQGKTLHLPSSSLPPYDNMTEESAFDNPIYETGKSDEETRQYEVSI
ncbi:LOW QUALITY PROTEIN: seizure protein 6 homolog [Colossoma macropomum]|uniref:LOW QUALITY PROTEIN: seizure protein 6 homolog n=1 Tax=Colossoma macropomum TaxID=42526 RepID=UPI0018651F15|nr:LOW QUALITY PROTEIN: seizure protein 6 homolog [Colossoma macropomum]